MYSFDVYDTLITRIVDKPKDIFRLMFDTLCTEVGYESLKEKISYDFPEARSCAEKKAKIKLGREVFLDDIYDELTVFYGLNPEETKLLKDLELRTETENTVPIGDNLDRVSKLIKDGNRVVLISDMYLSADFFFKLFEKVAPQICSLPLYVSCEAGLTKSDGLLYPYVADKEGVEYSEWTHIGDNKISDVNVPGLFGIHAELYVPDAEILSKKRHVDNTEIIWKHRTNIEDYDSMTVPDILNESPEFKVGYKYIGPVVYGYVSWIIKTAMDKGIKKLLFIARDGYILKSVADILIKEKNLNLETVYIYGSRKAWTPENDEDTKILKAYLEQEIGSSRDEFAMIDAKGTGRSINRLAKILGIRIKVFYYALLEAVGDKQIETFAYTSEGGLIEAFCRAPHGVTLGYKKCDDRIVPVLDESGQSDNGKAGIGEFINGACKYAEDVLCNDGEDQSAFWLSDHCMRKSVSDPGIELANVIGDIPHDENNEDGKYAPGLSKEEIHQIETKRTVEPLSDYYRGVNLQYSYKRLSDEDRSWLRKCKEDYLNGPIPEKDPNAIKICIYAFGVYGQELYHRCLYDPDINISLVVDKSNDKYQGSVPPVSALASLKTGDYDKIVIALMDRKQSDNVAVMLTSAGIDKDRILYYSEFEKQFLKSRKA